MPCSDVTEVVSLRLDAEDRLSGYDLNKRSCGRAVGESSLIADWAEGRPAAELAVADIDSFLDAHPTEDEAEELLYLKHFFALRAGIAVYLGEQSGSAADTCAVASLAYGPDGAEFTGYIRVDVLAEEIKSCGRCGKGCGKKRAAAKA